MKEINTMVRFEYKNSISINSLVKLIVCKKINKQTNYEPFDHHEKGLYLYDVMKFLDLYLTQKTDDGGITEIKLNEKKSRPVVYDIREDIKKAILQKKLTIDDFDTKDCNEYRICYESALTWCDNYPQPQYIFGIKPVKLNNIYLTLAAFLKINRTQEQLAAEIKGVLEENGKNISEDTIKRIFTESNNILNSK
jgi:hypothetical protein